MKVYSQRVYTKELVGAELEQVTGGEDPIHIERSSYGLGCGRVEGPPGLAGTVKVEDVSGAMYVGAIYWLGSVERPRPASFADGLTPNTIGRAR